jgi:hypothetical protein
LGAFAVGGSAPYNGDIADVLIFDRDITPAEDQAVRDYILARYGIGSL